MDTAGDTPEATPESANKKLDREAFFRGLKDGMAGRWADRPQTISMTRTEIEQLQKEGRWPSPTPPPETPQRNE